MQVREKVEKAWNTVYFQWFVAPAGRKVGSLKRRVRSQLARWEMKNCTRCSAKHIWKSKCRKHLSLGPFLEVEMSKSARHCGAKHIFKSKTHRLRTIFGSWDVQKVHAVVARSTFPSQNAKNTTCSDHLWTFRCCFAWQAQGILHLVKSE